MERHLIDRNSPIIDALHKLNDLSGSIMTLFVVDGDRVCGTLTDGDIRRALINGSQLSDKVDEVMHRGFRAIKGDDIDIRLIKRFRDEGIKLIPWLDKDDRLCKIINLSDGRSILPVAAILMAGGKGERLRPLTLDTPKPLLKIGVKAIIDYNVESLLRNGVSNIYVTTNYLAEQIHDHFAQPVNGVKINCVKEDHFMGTIGAASLVDLPEYGNTIVMNSDLLTNISFEDMYLHHIEVGADITIAVVPYQIQIPFAVLSACDSDPDRVNSIEEKPTFSYFTNAGIYIISNRLLRALPIDRRTDATDLVQQALEKGLNVTQFPINGTWIDVGSHADFRQANELIKYVQQTKT